ncbi:DUF255 domain-containing protein [bacterium]|nr:DUF255 domain-containing protein [bacterium]
MTILSFIVYFSVSWQQLTENPSKPIFLYIGGDGDNRGSIEKTLSTPKVSNLINENFIPVYYEESERPDLTNRYLYIKAPSITVVLPDGNIGFQSRNMSPITLQRDILSFLDAQKRDVKVDISLLQNRVYAAYFVENSNIPQDLSNILVDFLLKSFDYSKGSLEFSPNKIFPRFLYYSTLLDFNNESVKLFAQYQIDSMIKSNRFDKLQPEELFWSLMAVKNLFDSTDSKIYSDIFEKYRDKLSTFIKKDRSLSFLKNINISLKNMLDSLEKNEKISINNLKEFIDSVYEQFFDSDKNIFYDVKKGKEPFGIKFVSLRDNLDLAVSLLKYSELTSTNSNIESVVSILSFMNSANPENLLDTSYLYLMDRLKTVRY